MASERSDPVFDETLALAAYVFRVDLVTAEVTAALDAEGIESVLLKGPTTAMWLFGDGEARGYVDTDLLIRRCDWERTKGVVESLGFDDDLGPLAHPRMESGAGYPWKRNRDGAEVDLHFTLFGLGAKPDKVWDAFSSASIAEKIGGRRVRTPPHRARLLHIATHAVQHGGKRDQSMRDLELAIETVPRETWLEAGELAARLGALGTFAAAFPLAPGGSRFRSELGISDRAAADSIDSTMRLDDVPLAEGFAELANLPSLRLKLSLIAHEAVPNPSFMRWWSPLARRGRLGLLVAYVWRLAWLASRATPGWLAWRRAERKGVERGQA